ncbi:MAG: hypothetical protein ACYSRR_05970 [Planctomycetota bacterium]|jgi:hypothetical protein
MFKRLTILLLVFSAGSGVFGSALTQKNLLPEGFVLMGVDGKLITGENAKWFFELDESETSQDRLPAGTRLELLASSALQRIIHDSKDRAEANYRLWGTVTKYRDRNYIFLKTFVPLSREKLPDQQQAPQLSEPNEPVKINDPNDMLAIPDEVISKLRAGHVVRQEQSAKKKDLPELKADFILADRTVVLSVKPAGRLGFVFDGFGRNIEQLSLQLLACQTLERLECRQRAESESARFKIAGIVTEYNGQKYILAQRATRIYSQGNFDF